MLSKSEIVKHDASALIGKANGEDYFQAGYSSEIFHTLSEGEQLKGVYLGPGAKMEFTNPKTGEVNMVGVWRFRDASGNVVVNLLGSAQLDGRMASLKEGTHVVVQHKGKVKTNKGMMANDYNIFTKDPTVGAAK